MDSKIIRKRLRNHRRSLDDEQHARSAAQLRDHLITVDTIQSADHIGLYLVNDGEIDPHLFLHWAWQQHKHCYLPVLGQQKNDAMSFAPITTQSKFSPNRFGIPEPSVDARELIEATKLDVILMPLVAFDLNGNRIGMGGGFYDRTLAFTRQQPYHRRPMLIGLAYGFQQIDEIIPSQWDIPLDGITTELGTTLFEQTT